MKDLLDKLSSYNLFNYLLPGILFVTIAKEFTGYNFIQDHNLIAAFLYYFIGMVVSRFGSICIEPVLKKISFLKFTDYKKFIAASRKDSKIELLSEINNTYRTICSMFILLLLLRAYNYFQIRWTISNDISVFISVILIFFLFLFSYRKQTTYITKRIEANS